MIGDRTPGDAPVHELDLEQRDHLRPPFPAHEQADGAPTEARGASSHHDRCGTDRALGASPTGDPAGRP